MTSPPDAPPPAESPIARPVRHARRVAKWLAIGVGGIVGLVLLFVAYVAFVGITFDAGFLRPRIAAAFADAVGREVRFDGAAELEISGTPGLRVGGLHVADPGGFSQGTLISLGEVHLALNLWELLRHRLHIHDLTGKDVTVRLVAQRDGSNNWTIRPKTAAPPPEEKTPSGDGAAQAKDAALMLDVREFLLERIRVEYVTAAGTRHFFDLTKLRGESPQGQPVKIAMEGSVERSFPYQVSFTGGTLADAMAMTKPWPFDLRVDFLSTTLSLRGAGHPAGGEIDFAVGTANLSELERLLQAQYPKVGATALAGHVSLTPKSVAVTGLTGVMGKTALRGELSFDNGGPVPRIRGKLALPTLDLRPFLTDKPDEEQEPPKSLRDTYRELAKATFSLSGLKAADVDLELAVDRWLSLPGDVRDARLHLQVHDGKLDAPIEATITGVALKGGVKADGAANPPRFGLTLGTTDSDLGGLAELFAGARGMKGHLGRFALAIAAEGDQGAELVQTLDIRLDVERSKLSYGNIEGGRPVEFSLDTFSVALPAGKPLSGKLRGTLLGQPIQADLTGGALEKVMNDERTALDFDLRSGSVRAHLAGVLAVPTATSGPELAFDLTADRTSDVARWLGVKPGASAKVVLKGKAALTEDAWKVQDVALRLGRTQLTAAGALVREHGKPVVQVKLEATEIDVAELQSLLPPGEKKPAAETAPSRPVLQIPIMPKGIDLGDADVTLRVKKVTGTPLNPRDIAFDGRIRDGAMSPSAFAATVADVPFRGAISLDLRGEPVSSLYLGANDVDVGRLLRTFGLAQNIDAHIDSFQIALVARASLLGEMLERSELTGNLDGGRVILRDANTKAEARIALESGVLAAKPGAPVRLDLKGAFDTTPVTLSLETAKAADLLKPDQRIPFRFQAEAAETKVQLSGAIAKPVGKGDIELALAVEGRSFDRLNGLARAALPPWGPYALGGKFRMSNQGYAVEDLEFRVADSRLRGRGALVTAGAKPKLTIDLASPRIQLDDFKLGDWSATGKKEAPKEEKKVSAEEAKAKAAKATDDAQKLLSPAVLRRQDAYLLVKVDEVLSGPDKLGSGRLEAKLENGRADIGPMEVNVPGGSAKLWLGYEPTETEVKVNTKLRIERFDYGILARRFLPKDDYKGLLTVRMDVDSRTEALSDILKAGNGSLEFTVWPDRMPSGLVDLWAVNVFTALLPAVDKSKASKINCAVAKFDLQDGVLKHRTIVLDTSRMRVSGEGSVDFHTEKLHLRMAPKAKVPEFLSLAIPVEVNGTFREPKVGVAAMDVVGMVGKFATSIFWVPIQRLVEKPVAEDGGEVCGVDASSKAQ